MKLPSSDFTICVMIGQTNGNTEVLHIKNLMEDRLERQSDNPPGYLVVSSCSLLSLRPEGGQHQVQAREDLSGDIRDRGACSIEVRLGGERGGSGLTFSPPEEEEEERRSQSSG